MRLCVSLFILAVMAAPASAQIVLQGPGTYNTYGNTTYGPGGTQQRYGNQLYTPQGNYQTYGNTTYGPNGGTYQTYGNTTYGPNGTTSQTYGNTTYVNGPNGRRQTCTRFGNQISCN